MCSLMMLNVHDASVRVNDTGKEITKCREVSEENDKHEDWTEVSVTAQVHRALQEYAGLWSVDLSGSWYSQKCFGSQY